jgi:hypothetical protein
MELSSITDKLVQNLQRAQVEQVVALSKVLGLTIGSQFLANVQKVTQATPEERAELVKVIETNLAQLNKNSAAPAVKALIAQLQDQKILAQTATLKLANLTVNLPTTISPSTTLTVPAAPPAPINILTYTSQPVQVGQTLLMQLSEGQRLQLLQPLSKIDVATMTTLAQQSTSTNANGLSNKTELGTFQLGTTLIKLNNLAQQLVNTSLNTYEQPTSITPKTNTTTAKLITTEASNAIGETLRRLLPQKDKGQDLLTHLPKLTQFIQHLPISERKEWLSSKVQQSLKTLANHIRLSDQLNNPKLLEMTLKNNGQRFEQKLAQWLTEQKSSANLPNSSSPKTPPPSSLHPETTSAAMLATKIPQSSTLLMQGTKAAHSHNAVATTKVTVEKIATQDMKGSLLALLSDLNTELDTDKPAVLNLSPTADIIKNTAMSALPQFLAMLINKQQGELSQKQMRIQLVMLLHQYTLGSLAKIQLQQVHTLNHQLNQTDQAQPTQSWQFEIPVRHGQDVHPLSIHMEQRWLEETHEEVNEEKNTTRVRQWNIMLSFDLPLIGLFYAQLTLLNDSLSAKFWSENESTLKAAKEDTDTLKQQLEKQGINVTNIQCLQGVPPKPKMTFNYSLVDITT